MNELVNVGEMAFVIENVKRAKKYYELRNELITESSSSATLYDVSVSLALTGEMYVWTGEKKEAWKRYGEALEISEKLAEKFRDRIYWISVVYDLNRFSKICETKEEIEKAKEYSKRALKISESITNSKKYG